jgi:glucosamine-phosphate N-acetyltransferase
MWTASTSNPSSPAPPPANPSSQTHPPSFPPTLISPAVASALPPQYTIRPLQRSDYAAGLLDVLRVLTTVGDISEEAWAAEYDERCRVSETYYTIVVCDGEGKVVGTGTLFKERKL